MAFLSGKKKKTLFPSNSSSILTLPLPNWRTSGKLFKPIHSSISSSVNRGVHLSKWLHVIQVALRKAQAHSRDFKVLAILMSFLCVSLHQGIRKRNIMIDSFFSFLRKPWGEKRPFFMRLFSQATMYRRALIIHFSFSTVLLQSWPGCFPFSMHMVVLGMSGPKEPFVRIQTLFWTPRF